jgi:Sec-independent protein translocase protein TatA
MLENLEKIGREAFDRLSAAKGEADIEALSVSVLGRSGSLTEILRTMGKLHKDVRAQLGQEANKLKRELEAAIAEKRARIHEEEKAARFLRETVDITEPGKRILPRGRLHPMTQAYRDIRDALIGMGFMTSTPRSGPRPVQFELPTFRRNPARIRRIPSTSTTAWCLDPHHQLRARRAAPLSLRLGGSTRYTRCSAWTSGREHSSHIMQKEGVRCNLNVTSRT